MVWLIGHPEVAFSDPSVFNTVVTFVPATPLAANTLIQATLATGVLSNLLGPFSVNFTTCACVCRSTSPYEIMASESGGMIASGLDRTDGKRLCQWQLSASPGQILSLSLVILEIATHAASSRSSPVLALLELN